MVRVIACVVVIWGFVSGCQCGSAGNVEASPVSRALLEASADGALVTVIARPARWATLRDALVPLLPTEGAAAVRAAESPWGLLSGLIGGDVAGALPSLDPTRALALGLFIPAQSDLLESVAELVATRDGKGQGQPSGPSAGGLHGLRHRLILPARDANKLAVELRALLTRQGIASIDDATRDTASFAAVYPEGDHVRVELVRDDQPPAVDNGWRDGWKATLAKTPKADLAATAGLQHALSADAFATVFVQATRLRATHAAVGATTVADALRSVDSDMADLLIGVGSAEIMAGWSLLAPERAFVYDVAFTLDGADGLALTSVASLTARGQALFGAANEAAAPVAAPVDGNSGFARVGVALSFDSLLRGVELPAAFAEVDEQALAQLVLECGAFCRLSLHSLLVVFKRLLMTKPAELQGALPRSLALVVSYPPSVGAPVPVGLELALGYPTGSLPSAVMAQLRSDPMPGLSLDSVKVDGGELALVSLGMGPRPAFEAAARGPLMTLSIDVAGLGAALGRMLGPTVPPALQGDGRLVGRTELSGPALVSTLVLLPKAATPPARRFDFSAASVPRTAAITPGTVCLERAVASVAAGWKAIGNHPPEEGRLIAAKTQVASELALKCAEAADDTKAAAATLRTLSLRFR